MEVILREDFLTLGYVGDTVSVRRGFARNYLIPNGIAVEASSGNERQLKHKLSAIIAKRIKKKTEAEEFAKVLGQVTVELTLKVGTQGKSFGSITGKDIESKLKELGYNVDRRQIKLADPIRSAGSFEVEVKLHSEVSVGIQVKVEAEKPAGAPKLKADAKNEVTEIDADIAADEGEAADTITSDEE
jgi:large subunit ribosomal protein L9